MTVPDLVDRYTELFGKPPRVKHREHLWKRCAWKIQERKFGGLSELAKRRLEELISEIDLPLTDNHRTISGVLKEPRRANTPPVGTTLFRLYKGREIRVAVVENGFEWKDVHYRSLSAVAKAITGSHWNGRLFFQLTKRSGK